MNVYFRHAPGKCPTATDCQGHTERASGPTLAALEAMRRLDLIAYMAAVPRRPWWRRLLGR